MRYRATGKRATEETGGFLVSRSLTLLLHHKTKMEQSQKVFGAADNFFGYKVGSPNNFSVNIMNRGLVSVTIMFNLNHSDFFVTS